MRLSDRWKKVFSARYTLLKREVAIKELPESVRQDPERLKRFRREAEAAAKLKHNNIATINALEDVDIGSNPTKVENPSLKMERWIQKICGMTRFITEV